MSKELKQLKEVIDNIRHKTKREKKSRLNYDDFVNIKNIIYDIENREKELLDEVIKRAEKCQDKEWINCGRMDNGYADNWNMGIDKVKQEIKKMKGER